MRKIFLLLGLLVCFSGLSQNPDYHRFGARSKYYQPDTLSTTLRDALTPKLGTILYHKDTGISQWEQWDGSEWVEFGREYDVVPRDSLIVQSPQSFGNIYHYWAGTEAQLDAEILADPNFEDNKFIVCTDCPQTTYLTPTGNGSGLTGLTTSQITNLSSYTGFDSRYYTETESDVRYLRKDADNNYANLLRYTSSGSVHNDAVRSFYGTDSDFSVFFSAGTNSAVIDLISASSLIIRDNGTNRVEITDSGTVSATNFILSSDKRLKENFKDLGNGYYSFNFKGSKEKRYGVIAQEVKVYAPELVSEGEDGYLKVAYIDLLIKKQAEQEKRITYLWIVIGVLSLGVGYSILKK